MKRDKVLHSDFFNRFLETFNIEWPCELRHEFERLDKMSEDDACEIYNVDSKDEARQCIIEYYK
jgi:hypothetical protein